MVTVQLGRNKWKRSWRSCFDQSYYCLICLVLDWPRLRQGAAAAQLRFALPLWGPTHVDRLHLLSSKQLWSNFFMSSVLWGGGGYIINHVRIKSRCSAPDDVHTPARCRLYFGWMGDLFTNQRYGWLSTLKKFKLQWLSTDSAQFLWKPNSQYSSIILDPGSA